MHQLPCQEILKRTLKFFLNLSITSHWMKNSKSHQLVNISYALRRVNIYVRNTTHHDITIPAKNDREHTENNRLLPSVTRGTPG